jgi:hypothetical protein
MARLEIAVQRSVADIIFMRTIPFDYIVGDGEQRRRRVEAK